MATASRVGRTPVYVMRACRGRVAMGMSSTDDAGMSAHAYVIDVIET